MAGEAYYNTGTATVAVNSKTVTGTGTNWLSAVGGLTAIKAGDKFGIHVGRPIIIASVDSNTQLTLEDNWPGPAQTNAAYKIELTNPDVIAVEAMRRLLGSLGSGVLYGLSQLPSTPSRLLGIDENGLTALLATIPNGQLPTRLQAMPTLVTAANALDNITETGWVRVSSANIATVNGPTGGGSGLCFTIVFDGNAAIQFYTTVTSAAGAGRQWFRNKAGGTWTGWTQSLYGDVTNASNLLSGTFRGWNFGNLNGSTTLDANALVGNGLFSAAAGSANTPVGTSGWGYILQFQRDAERKTQVCFDSITSAARVFIRTLTAAGWTAWRELPIGQTSATDTTAGAAMLVGAFGLGSIGTLLTNTDDLNSLPVTTAFYRWGSASAPANTPETGSFTLLQMAFGNGGGAQIACNLSSNNTLWYRKQAGSSWTSWTRIDGDVSGPTVAIDNAPVGFSGTSGKSIKQLTGPVAALHAVTGAANKLPYFTGASAMATTDLSAFARTLLDDADGAAMFATMGATFSGTSAAGSAKLPSGLELKWGTSVNSLSDFRQLFPIAFANDCFVALPVNTFDYGGAADRFIGVSTSNVDKNGFDIRARNITNGGGVAGQGNAPIRWFAMGY